VVSVLRTIWMALVLLLFLGSGARAARQVASQKTHLPQQPHLEKSLAPIPVSVILSKPPLSLDLAEVPVSRSGGSSLPAHDGEAPSSPPTRRPLPLALAPVRVRSPRAPPALCLLRLFL
jgi:hypothetical protein